MNWKQYLFLAVLAIGAVLAAGYWGSSQALDKLRFDQTNQAMKQFAIDESRNYLLQHPNGAFNETAKRIYKEFKGTEYVPPEDLNQIGQQILNQKAPPPIKIPCYQLCV